MQWFHIESTLESLGGLVKTLIAELCPHNFWFSRCAVDPWICIYNKCQDIFINYGCMTNHLKTDWLKTANIYYLRFVDEEFSEDCNQVSASAVVLLERKAWLDDLLLFFQDFLLILLFFCSWTKVALQCYISFRCTMQWCSIFADCYRLSQGSQVVLVVNSLPANTGDLRNAGSIPGWGRSPGGRQSKPLQYSCQENPKDREAWQAMVHSVAESQTRLNSDLAHTHKLLEDNMCWMV